MNKVEEVRFRCNSLRNFKRGSKATKSIKILIFQTKVSSKCQSDHMQLSFFGKKRKKTVTQN
jgi:hypothetical protein